MAIRKLTDSKTLALIPRQLPKCGTFWKGDPKNDKGHMGKDRSDGSWRVSFEEEFGYVADIFNRMFPDTTVPFLISMIGDNPDACLDDYMRLYSGNNITQRVCDGHDIIFATDGTSKCLDCPLAKDERGKQHCAPSAYFRFTIPMLNRVCGEQLMFQFNITSQNEIQQFAKELDARYKQTENLQGEVFVLRRMTRVFNRDGKRNPKSLAYLSGSSFEVEEQKTSLSLDTVQPAQTQIEGGTRQPAPQLMSGNGGDEITITPKDQFMDTATEWITKYLGMIPFDFIYDYTDGTMDLLAELYDEHGDIETFRRSLVQWVVKNEKTVRVYGFRTLKHGKTQRMLVSFGFGMLYSYTRKDFKDYLGGMARNGYVVMEDGQEHSMNVARYDSGRQLQDGTPYTDHSCKNLFAVEYVLMKLALNKKGELVVEGFYPVDEPF